MNDKTENCEFTTGIIGNGEINEEIVKAALEMAKVPMSIKVEEDGDGNISVETTGAIFKLIAGIEMIAKQIETDFFPAEFIICSALLHMTGDKKIDEMVNEDEQCSDRTNN